MAFDLRTLRQVVTPVGRRGFGLIQFGIPEQQRYGVTQRTPAEQQVDAAGRFLVDRGFKPIMGLADLYSAINAGHVGLYGLSDAGNGGAPGTVMDKVTQQMGGHRAKAEALLGGGFTPAPAQVRTQGQPAGQTPQAGTTLADALPEATLPTPAPAASPTGLAKAPSPSRSDQQAALIQRRAEADNRRRQALLSVSAFSR